ncbi:MAG TPA: sulfotransferase family 2 domain-containing protein [Polyangium sp.]|nr:sulfotransferase family 2 domain-containing protein [Polyangium sp.]
MFISHKYQAIFVHIQRTGGNSIQKIFADHDPDLVETIPIDPSKQRTKHAWITDIVEAIPNEIFTRYVKFSVVRNPFERMVSWYFHFKDDKNAGDADVKVNPHANPAEARDAHDFAARFTSIGDRVKYAINTNASTFEQFVMLPRDHPEGLFERLYANQIDYVSQDGHLLVDDVLRFENLTQDFDSFAHKIRFPGRPPHVNASSRHKRWQEHYSPQTKAIIAERFRRDCERWSYGF